MRLDIWGVLGVSLGVLSLFLPWLSVMNMHTQFNFDSGYIQTLAYAPIHIDARVHTFDNGSMNGYSEESYWDWREAYGFENFTEPHILHEFALFLGVCSLCLALVGSFIFEGWAKVGKRIRLTVIFLWLSSAVSQFYSMAWLVNMAYGTEILAPTADYNVGDYIFGGVGYLNIGLAVVILSGVLFFVSWLSPKYILSPTNVKVKKSE